MGKEQSQFNLDLEQIHSIPCGRATTVYWLISEAYGAPNVRNHGELIDKVARLLVENPQDMYAIQILYAYVVGVGSERLDPILQELGHYIVRRYGVPFEMTEMLLNFVVKRLAELGHMRQMQRHQGSSHKVFHPGHSSLAVPMKNITPGHMMQGHWEE